MVDENDEEETTVHAGWETVVLPGGGHPAHVVDRTELLAVDAHEPAAAISTTARLSLGAPEPVDAVDTDSLTGIRSPARVDPSPAMPTPMRGPSPQTWAIPRVGLASPPKSDPPVVPAASPAAGRSTAPATGGQAAVLVASEHPAAPATDRHAAVPVGPRARRSTAPPTEGPAVVSVAGPTDGHPVAAPTGGGQTVVVISGAHPVVGPTSSGGHPVVPQSGPRGRGPAPITGAHAGLRAANDDTTRLAWGFLLGVVITVAIIGVAAALALYFMG